MSLTSRTVYSLVCDICRSDFDKPDDPAFEISVFMDKDQLAEVAKEADWTTNGALWRCPNCPQFRLPEPVVSA